MLCDGRLLCIMWCILVSALHVVFVFFKQKTAYEMRISYWSSDVCSSDLRKREGDRLDRERIVSPPACGRGRGRACWTRATNDRPRAPANRSEERRVGKECVSR